MGRSAIDSRVGATLWLTSNGGASVDNEPFVKDISEVFDKAEKYERLEKYYPNILARLNAAGERREKK